MLIETNELYQDTVTWWHPSKRSQTSVQLIKVLMELRFNKRTTTHDVRLTEELTKLFDSKGALVMSLRANNDCGTFSLGHRSGFHVLTVESASKIIFRQKFVF